MASKYHVPDGDHAVRVDQLFTTIARRYDFINDLQSLGLHRRWKRRVVKMASVRPGERALDLCCGTGDISFALARAGAEVVGLDFNEPMLAIAGERAKDELPDRKAFLRGDAQKIPFADDTFDVVTIGYGLRNLTSWETGLREMQRVARPGGRLLVLDFGKPDNAVLRAAYFAYLRHVCPLLGRVFCGDPDTHTYILESLMHYAAQRGVEARMREMRLANVKTVNLMGGMMSINYGEKAR